MQVTKLERSGYMVEYPEFILVFNYTRDQKHSVEKTLRDHPEKTVVFFVSHNHRYTFDTDIFNLAQSHRRVYVLSNDIPSREVHDNMPIAWVSAGDRLEDVAGKNISIEGLKVGGNGVGYFVNADNTTILFGGSLGEDTDKQRTEVLVERIASEHQQVTLAIVSEGVADLVAAKIAASEVETYQ